MEGGEFDSLEGEDSSDHIAKDPIYPLRLDYCPVCTLPPEYCRYSEKWPQCEAWRNANTAHDTGAEGESLSERVELISIQKDTSRKNKKEVQREVVISTIARTKKKHITCISGLSSFGIKLNEASKLFSKHFAASSTISKEEDKILVQGMIAENLGKFILSHWPRIIDEDCVYLLQNGKHKSMRELRLFAEDLDA